MTITTEEFSKIKISIPNWEAFFLDIPFERILKSRKWEKPFNAIDPKLSLLNFSYPDQYAEDMYSRTARGHGWFGVGEWNVANRQYLNALATAIAINETDAIANIVRFLVETYIAGGNYQSAVNLMNDFISFTDNDNLESNNMKQIFEAVIVGSLINNDSNKCKELMEKMKSYHKSKTKIKPDEWEFVRSLIDIYKFRNNLPAYSALMWALLSIRNLIDYTND